MSNRRWNTNHIIPWKIEETYSGRWKNKPFTTTPIGVKIRLFNFHFGGNKKIPQNIVARKHESRSAHPLKIVFFRLCCVRRRGGNNASVQKIAATIIQKSSLIATARIHFPYQPRKLREATFYSLIHPCNKEGNSELSLREQTRRKTLFQDDLDGTEELNCRPVYTL